MASVMATENEVSDYCIQGIDLVLGVQEEEARLQCSLGCWVIDWNTISDEKSS